MVKKDILNFVAPKPKVMPKIPDTPLGSVGYDNARDNIDPHIKTKVLSTIEGTIQTTPVNSKDIVNKDYVDTGDTAAKVMTNHTAGNHKIFYSNGSGAVVELAHGTSSYVLTSNGATSAPSWQELPTPAVPIFSQTQPARALNTTYQNTTGKHMIVYGSIACRWHDNGTDIGYFTCKSDGSSPPTTARHKGGTIATAFVVTANTLSEQSIPFNFIVKAGDYYRIDTTVAGTWGRAVLEYWNEVINLDGS